MPRRIMQTGMSVCGLLFFLITFPLLVPGEVKELDEDSLAQVKAKAANIQTSCLIMFYAPRCPFSKRALPVFREASAILPGIFPKLHFAQIDANKYAKNLSGFVIPGYPTIVLLMNGTVQQYDGDNSVEKLEVFVAENLLKQAQ